MSAQASLDGKIAHGAAVAMAANVVYLFSRLALTPFILAHVSIGEYGLWALCFVILSYAGMSAFGINNSYIKYTAEYLAAGRIERIAGLLSTGLCVMGAVSVFFFAALAWAAPFCVRFFRIDPGLADTAVFLLLGTSLAFLLDLTLGAFRGVLEGLQEVARSKYIWLAANLLEAALVVAFLHNGFGIRGVLYAYFIKSIVDVGGAMALVFLRLPQLRLSPALISRAYVNELFVFGGKVQVLGLLGMFMGSLDRLIITGMLGVEATGLLEVGRKLPFTARSITGAASAPFLPAASALGGWWRNGSTLSVRKKMWKYGSLCLATLLVGAPGVAPLALDVVRSGAPRDLWLMAGEAGLWLILTAFPGMAALRLQWGLLRRDEYLDAPGLRELYLNGSRALNGINFMLYGFIMAATPQVFLAWVGPGFEKAYQVCLAVSFMCVIHLATLACSSLMRGINRSGRELEAVLINLVLMLMWVPAWTHLYGLYGTVWGVSLSTAASSLHFIARTNLAFRIGWVEYLRQAAMPAMGPLLAGGGVYAACSMLPPLGRWEALGVVGALGVAYVAGCLMLLKHFVLTAQEWSTLARQLRRTPGVRIFFGG